MPVTFVSKSADGETTGTGFTATEPTGASLNDILFLWVVVQTGLTNWAPPALWTLLVDLSNGGGGDSQNFAAWLYWIRRGTTAPALNASWTSTKFYSVSTTCWRGCKLSGNPYNASAGLYAVTNPSAPNPPSISITAQNAVAVALGASWTGPTVAYTAPTGFTIREAGAAGTAVCVASKIAGVGTEDPGVFGGVPAGANGEAGATVALQPEPGGQNLLLLGVS